MIDKIRTIVLKVQWLKPVMVVLAVAALGLFGYIIFGQTGVAKNDYYLLPSVVALIWSLVACAFLFTFPFVPDKPDKSIGFFRRCGIRIKRGYYHILSVLCLFASLALVVVTSRAVGVWLGDFGS
ncbi:MAG: hypothetical protein MJK04_15390 [Psychrosphaera sp.]|nr:hypothetical protein [Psychrosphaera sp.]